MRLITSYSVSATSTGADVRTHRLPLDPSGLIMLQTADGGDMRVTSLERTVLR